MSIFKRAILYITRKKKKSLTLLVTLWLVATALISGIAVRNAGIAAGKQFAKQQNSMLHIENNMKELIGDGYGSGEIPEKAMQAIAANPNVERVNNMLLAYAELTKENMVTKTTDAQDMGKVLLVYGNTYTKYDSKFTAGMVNLKEGRHIEPTDRHVMMVHEAFAKTNHLTVGSKIKVGKDPRRNPNDKELVEATIIGIFSGKTSQSTDYPYEMLENAAFSDEQFAKDLYGYAQDKAFYSGATVFPKQTADMEALNAFIKQQDISWAKYDLTENDFSLKTYAKSIEVLNRLVDAMRDGVILVAIVLVSMALFFWIGGRTHETGILLAIGQPKLAIVAQYALEVTLIAFIAFGLSTVAGQWVGQKLGDSLVYQASRSARADFLQSLSGGMNLGADSDTDMLLQTIKKITISVSANEIMNVFLIGTLVILIAVIGTSLIIARYKPSEILSKMS